MLFQETETPGVYRDEKGEMWPLGADMVTKLRNNGNVFMGGQSSSGGGDGGAKVGLGPAWAPNPVERVGAAAPSAQAPVKMGIGPAFAVQPGSGGAPPLQAPVKRDFEAMPQQGGSDWQFNGSPRQPSGVQQLPSQPMLSRVSQAQPGTQQQGSPQLQRVMPRDRGEQQQAPQGQRYYKQVGSKPGAWVDTARQTSGWSEEQQADMADRLTEERDATYKAKMAEIGAYEANANDAKMRAERSYVENANKMIEEQRKLDTQNLYIENQQKKVGERIKAAREKQVDPTQPFSGVGGGIAGVLAVLGAGLGQYGAGINGGPNNALSLFNNMIDRSVNEQLRLIEEEKEGALMSKAELDDFRFTNNEEKKAYIRSLELAKHAADIDSVTADESLRAVHPMALQAKAAADERMNQDLMTVNSAINRTAGQQYRPPQAGGTVDVTEQVLAGQAKESGYRKTIRENNEAASGGMIGEASIVAPDGAVIGKAPNAARAEKLNERLSAFGEAERLATQMLDISNEQRASGSMFRAEGDKARYRSLATRYKNALWSASRGDAPSEAQDKAFEEAMGGIDLANFQSGKQQEVLQQTLEDGRGNIADRIQQQGGDPSYLRKRKPNAKNEGYTP